VKEKTKQILKALNQLLSYQLAINLMPFDSSLCSFIQSSFKQIDGIKECRVCLSIAEESVGDLINENCLDCKPAIENNSTIKYNCLLLNRENITVIPVQTFHQKYGFITLLTDDNYEPDIISAIKNFANIIALNIENNQQKIALEKQNTELLEYQTSLEQFVLERTFELENTIKELIIAKETIEENEQKLKTAYHYARSLIEASLDPLVTINSEGKITDANLATENSTGLSRDKLIGTDFSDYFTEPEKARAGYQQVFESGFVIDYPLTICNTSNKLIDVLYNASVYHDEQGKIIGIVAAARDITERKQAELIIKQQNDELIKINTDKDRFISILAHDLKSPFNSLLGFSNLLFKNIRKYDIDKIENQVSMMNDSICSTFSLLEDILLWARKQQGKLPFELQEIRLAEICNDINEHLKVNARNKNITLNYFETKPIHVVADKNMLNTILRNLVSNAIKFTNYGGKINIYAEINKINTIITVADNGIGINPNQLPLLFDITEVFTTEGTAHEKGTGLGLPICKDFVEKHGGKIWVESEVGKGSDFKFTLPEK